MLNKFNLGSKEISDKIKASFFFLNKVNFWKADKLTTCGSYLLGFSRQLASCLPLLFILLLIHLSHPNSCYKALRAVHFLFIWLIGSIIISFNFEVIASKLSDVSLLLLQSFNFRFYLNRWSGAIQTKSHWNQKIQESNHWTTSSLYIKQHWEKDNT